MTDNQWTHINKFMPKWTIDSDKLPRYNDFRGNFRFELENATRKLMKTIIENNDSEIDLPLMKEFTTKTTRNVLQHMLDNSNDGYFTIKHFQSKGIGRFYATDYNSLVSMKREVKHTLLKQMKFVDIDMGKFD
jgi:hypothetical protein